MDKIKEFVGLNVRHYRKKLGLTQLALATEVGCSLPTIQRIETGIQYPKADMLDAIAKALNVSEIELFKDSVHKGVQRTIADMTPDEFKNLIKEQISAGKKALPYSSTQGPLTYKQKIYALVESMTEKESEKVYERWQEAIDLHREVAAELKMKTTPEKTLKKRKSS